MRFLLLSSVAVALAAAPAAAEKQQADQIIHVELDKTRFKQLGLSVGQHTWLKPRYSRVFLGEGI